MSDDSGAMFVPPAAFPDAFFPARGPRFVGPGTSRAGALRLSGTGSLSTALAMIAAEGSRRHPSPAWELVAQGFDADRARVYFVQRWRWKGPGPERIDTLWFDLTDFARGAGVPLPLPGGVQPGGVTLPPTPPPYPAFPAVGAGYVPQPVRFEAEPGIWVEGPAVSDSTRETPYVVRGAPDFATSVRAARGAARQLMLPWFPDAQLVAETRDDRGFPPYAYLVVRWVIPRVQGLRNVPIAQWFEVGEPLRRGSGALASGAEADATATAATNATSVPPAQQSVAPTPSTQLQAALSRNDTLRRVVSAITFLSFGAAAGTLLARVAKRAGDDPKPPRKKASAKAHG